MNHHKKNQLVSIAIIRACLRDFRLGIITPKTRMLSRVLGTHTLVEMKLSNQT